MPKPKSKRSKTQQAVTVDTPVPVEEKPKVPENIRPYLFHGLDLHPDTTGKEMLGECPWCGAEGKFTVDISRGVYRCLVCSDGTKKGGGNATVFVRSLLDQGLDSTPPSELRKFADSRGLEFETLVEWEVAKSPINGRWMVPGYNASAAMTNLYLYTWLPDKNSWRLLLTPTLGHQMFGMNLYRPSCEVVYLCEGPWDAMRLWQALKYTKWDPVKKKYTVTHNRADSLLSYCSVIGVPGTNTFFPSWLPVFRDKAVNLCFDNDHPRVNRLGKEVPPAGYVGMKRAAGILSGVADTIRYLRWGDQGFDTALPTGTDVRDMANDILPGGTYNAQGRRQAPKSPSGAA